MDRQAGMNLSFPSRLSKLLPLMKKKFHDLLALENSFSSGAGEQELAGIYHPS